MGNCGLWIADCGLRRLMTGEGFSLPFAGEASAGLTKDAHGLGGEGMGVEGGPVLVGDFEGGVHGGLAYEDVFAVDQHRLSAIRLLGLALLEELRDFASRLIEGLTGETARRKGRLAHAAHYLREGQAERQHHAQHDEGEQDNGCTDLCQVLGEECR